jgi:PAS domain S-box-containing protein
MGWLTRDWVLLNVTILMCALLPHEAPLAAPGTERATDGRLALTDAEKSWIAQHPVVRIQMSDRYPPFEFRENDRYQGMGYDYLSVISKRLGIEFQITGLTWSQALEAIQEKRDVDLLLAVTRSPEREKIVQLTRAYLRFPQVVITRRQGQFVGTVQDLAGSTVAVEKDYVMVAWLQRDIPTAKLILTEDTAMALEAVATGEANAYVGNLAAARYLIEKKDLVDLRVAAPTDYGEDALAMGVRKDWPELARLIDKALGSMTEKERQAIRQKWLSCACGWRTLDVLKWILIVAGVALVFIVQLRVQVNRRTADLRSEVELRQNKEDALRESEERYRRLVQLSSEGIWRVECVPPVPVSLGEREQATLILERARGAECNDALVRQFGYARPEEILGRPLTDFMTGSPEEKFGVVTQFIRSGYRLTDWEARKQTQDGRTLWTLGNAVGVVEDGTLQFVWGTQRDITARKGAEEALRRSAERLRALHEMDQAILGDQSPEAIAQAAVRFIRRQVPCQRASFTVYDSEGAGVTILATQVNGETRLAAGTRLPLEEMWVPPELQRGEAHVVEDLLNLPQPRPIDRRLQAEGIRSYISVPLVAQGKLLGSLNLAATSPGAFATEHLQIAREVADQIAIALQQVQLFRSVSRHREELRTLTARLAEVEESERRRLARELHDRVGQSLTALGINLNILRGQFPLKAAGKSTDRLEDSLRLVEETIGSIRNVMTDLRPPVLDDYGLVAALRWYGTQFSTRTGVPTQVRGEEPTPRLPPDMETGLFRIAQEALTNVSKHARATQIRITLETGADNVRLTIADDGVGFDPKLLREHGEGSGWGLINIRERAEALGGKLQVDTALGKGTRISVQVEG